MKFFFKYNLIFFKPKKCDILIYKTLHKETLLEILREKTEILDLNEINLFIFFLTIFKLRFNKKEYINTYISFCNPKILITCQDDDVNFYKIDGRKHKLKKIAIQYGIRSDITWIEFQKNRSKNLMIVDYLVCFSEFEAKKYKKYIDIKNVHTFGSIINNFFPKKWNKSKDVIFISQLRLNFRDNPVLFSLNKKNIFFDDFYKIDHDLLPMVDNFCRDKNLNLVICGASKAQNEKKYYEQVLNHSNFKFIDRDGLSSYEVVSNSCFVISIDSTLGYESFARKIPTVFFPARFKYIKEESWKSPHSFHKIPTTFWSDNISVDVVNKILNTYYKIESDEFREMWANHHESLMCYDKNNQNLKRLITSLLD